MKDGVLLWSQQTAPPEIELHALRLDGSMGDTILSTGLALHYFSGYDVSGDSVVWAGYGSEAGVYLYKLKTRTRTQLPSPGGHNPLIDGNKVMWTEEPSGGYTGGAVTDWSIKVYDTVSGKLSLATKEHTEWAQAAGITEQGSIAYVKGEVYRELYLISPTP